MLTYLIYDVIISSEIELFNIPQISGAATARIVYADHPSSFIPEKEYCTYYSPNISCMGTKYGTMEVRNGDTIEIFLYEGYTSHDITPFIIGWGFSFLFSQRQYTCFHCSALKINDKGVLVSGVSGAGKSTIALSLIDNGAQYLADDMAIIAPKKSFDITPAYPLQKVCRDVSEKLDEAKLVHINEGRDKFAYYNESDFCDKPVLVDTVVLLNKADIDEVRVEEIKGLNKYLKILSCMYLAELYASFGTPEFEKYNCLQVAGKVRVIEITRPTGKDTVNEITNIIKEFV